MKNRSTSTVEPALIARKKKDEERVYLDPDLVAFLDRLQKRRNFRRRSQALRYCIEQEYGRDPILPSVSPTTEEVSKRADRQLTGSS